MIIHQRALACMGPAALFILFIPGIAQARTSSPKPPCDSAASCNQLGTQAFKRGDIPAAIQLFKLQVGYAEDAQDAKQSAAAYNNLALAYMRERDYLRASAWTRLALQADSKSQAAKHNLIGIQKGLAHHRWPTNIGGTYVQYAGRTQWNSLCVSKLQDKGFHFRLLAYRMGAAWRRYGPAALGDLKGEATLTAEDDAQYKGAADFPTCHIEMKFTPNGVTLEQQGDCGFGHGVRAAGHYERINTVGNDNCDEHGLP